MILAMSSVVELQVPLAGKLLGDSEVSFAGVSTDSRTVEKGNLFVALRGENHDGHDYVEQAIQGGSSALVVSRDSVGEMAQTSVPVILVGNTSIALGRLGAINRLKWKGELLALTGSNGKTSLKEMLGAIIGKSALLTPANNNNTLGVPMTLLSLSEEHEFAVIEIGTDRPGEIGYSASIAKPSIAIVNNLGKAHLAGFSSHEELAREKGSILTCLNAGGVAIVNGDDEFCPLWQEMAEPKIKGDRFIKFGYSPSCDVRLSEVQTQGTKQRFIISLSKKLSTYYPDAMSVEQEMFLPLPGKHNAMNAAAAFAGALCLGFSPKTIAEGLAKFKNVPGRLSFIPLRNGCFLLDDSYNANPHSMMAGLETLAEFKDKRIIALLGDMYELGKDELTEHRAIGEFASGLELDHLFTCGNLAQEIGKGYREHRGDKNVKSFATIKELKAYLGKESFDNTGFLVKASRAAEMDKVADFLRKHIGEREEGEE